MSSSDPERDPIDVLAEEFAVRCRQGENPSVSEYVLRHPEWADQLRQVLQAVAKIEEFKCLQRAVIGTTPAGLQLQQLGDFRILREIGRGGMGIVYEAMQESLGRRIALKVLSKQSLLNAKTLERFQREAQAAARLHHSHIVPVFGVGAADGLHYYVMQFIEGKGLHEVMAAWLGRSHTEPVTSNDTVKIPLAAPEPRAPGLQPQPLRSLLGEHQTGTGPHWQLVARIGTQVAEALQHAHQQGTLHRDIKPANLLLDLAGNAWVTDFGLAKVTECAGITSTGEILGTLNYMAPEVFRGQVDARSDVYSLGLTLYELLTLQRPYDHTTPPGLIQQIHDQDPKPPRQLIPAIPRDLETIILKAIARDPNHRYPTAAAFAEDLRRYLEDRPIQARRLTPAERLWRWCRRNRAVAGLAALLVLVFLAGFAGVVWKWQEAKANNAVAVAALARESKLRAGAENNVKLCLQAFEDIFRQLEQRSMGPPMTPPPGGPPPPPPWEAEYDAALRQSILDFYDRFADQNATNAHLQLDAARAYRHVGELLERLGENEKARGAFRRAAGILERLAGELQFDPEYRFERAETDVAGENRSLKPEDLNAAQARLRRALGIAEDLSSEFPGDERYRMLQARVQSRLGGLLERRGEHAAAEACYRKSVTILQALAGQPGASPMALFDLCLAREVFAEFLLNRDRPAEACALYEESIQDLQRGRQDGPRFGPGGGPLATQYRRLATALRRQGETARADEAARKADELSKKQFPFPPGPPPPPPRGGKPFFRD